MTDLKTLATLIAFGIAVIVFAKILDRLSAPKPPLDSPIIAPCNGCNADEPAQVPELVPVPQRKRTSNRVLVKEALRVAPESTASDIARLVGLSDIEVRRRISDLKRDGAVERVGYAKEGRRRVSKWVAL
jgi:hypothetical protein